MITREFDLMLYQEGNLLFINANQYDSGEQWIFTLYEENGVKYTPATGAIVGVKSDGKGIINTGTVDEYGRVVINETQQMTAAAGLATFELLIDNDTHGTANFKVDVEPRPADNADLSDSDLSLIQEAIDSAEVIVEVIGDSDPSEVIGEHVDAWLDNHPEATTTVLDGAITAPKINQSLWDKLLVSEEASGEVASFDDGADDVPVSSLKVALEPVQLGSGDPSPSNVRPIIASNGKNLLQVTATTQTINGVTFTVNADGTVRATGTATSNRATFSLGSVNFKANTGYILNGCPSGGSNSTYNMNIAGAFSVDTGNGGAVYTPTADVTYAARIDIYPAAGNVDLLFKPMIRLASITDSTFQPYQGIMVERTGRNLYPIAIGRDVWGNNASGTHSTDNDVLTVTVTTASSSGVYSSGSSQFASLTPTLTGTYSYSLSAKASANGNYIIGFYGAGRETKAVTTQWQRYTFTGTFDGTGKSFNIYGTGTAGTIEIKDFMLEMGSEAHEYVPYASASYPYTLGQSVYGGTVDLATGVLTVTWTSRTINGSENWTREYASATHHKYYITDTAIAKPTSKNYKISGIMMCDKILVAVNSYSYITESIEVTGWTGESTTLNYLYLIVNNANMGFDTVDGLKAWLASNPLQVAYKLATPQTYQLTPTEVKTLLGYNNISSTGTVDVIYHADTKLYVDKMTNVDNAIIAPTEADFVATRNYTVNDLVIVNDTLYKVTANIASGSTITPNSNVTQTTLGALIKALS